MIHSLEELHPMKESFHLFKLSDSQTPSISPVRELQVRTLIIDLNSTLDLRPEPPGPSAEC